MGYSHGRVRAPFVTVPGQISMTIDTGRTGSDSGLTSRSSSVTGDAWTDLAAVWEQTYVFGHHATDPLESVFHIMREVSRLSERG